MSVEGVSDASGVFEVPETEEYKIRPEEKYFSKEFTVLKNNWPVAVISTNRYAYSFFRFFDWRMHFTVVDTQTGREIVHAVKNYGLLSFQGLWNLSFLGLFRPHTLADFDLYDGEGNYIGFIDGKVLDLSKARFDFQDSEGNVLAYAREEQTQLTIKDSKTDAPLGFMQRKFIIGVEDSWTLTLSPKLDSRIALVFASFIVQNQSYFLKDV
ncbi:MAG: hypothetical protein KDK76_04195 [Chlamydiia bacterium]|nr:hypothetical protein [Chlamydiia bacterium]